MDTDELEKELENKFAVSRAPPLLNSNRFSVLEVTEPEVDEDAQEPSEPPALPPPEPRKPRRPKWEKRIKCKQMYNDPNPFKDDRHYGRNIHGSHGRYRGYRRFH